MITYEFDYARAHSVDEALSLLAEHGDAATLLAGGHSLLPAMKLRLASPGTLIDISGLDELTGIRHDGGKLHIGAMTTHRMVEDSDLARHRCPILSDVAAKIGDPQVRNRGTIGGSIAHADPAADYPAVVLALGADLEMVGADGRRSVSADDFFTGMFETALKEGEILTRISVPVLDSGKVAAYAKFANPASRYAVVGVAVMLEMDGDTCQSARIAVTGAAPTAFRATDAENRLQGATLDAGTVADAVSGMADASGLLSDLSGSAAYRAHLCEVMAKRAIMQATS